MHAAEAGGKRGERLEGERHIVVRPVAAPQQAHGVRIAEQRFALP